MQDSAYMLQALRLAQAAADENEVPVGAVVVQNGTIVGRGRNRREEGQNALAHAEIEAIDEACRSVGYWRLPDCDLYVTLEPCPMCAGAIINARIRRLIFAAYDPKAGCCGSVLDLFAYPFNHHPVVEGGLMEAESVALLQAFFQRLRSRPKADKPKGSF